MELSVCAIACSQVVNIAKEYTEQLTSQKIIELFESQNCYHGLYFYLGARIAFSEVSTMAVGSAVVSISALRRR